MGKSSPSRRTGGPISPPCRERWARADGSISSPSTCWRRAGEDLTGKPLTERKRRLQALLAGLPEQSPIHYSDHIHGDGKAVLAKICAAGHEGIVSKKATAPYRGTRTKTWLKIKCQRRQELVIGGWTPSEKRHGFKSLLLGAWEDGKLIYRGRVGTGFDEKDLEELSARFAKLARKTSPFAEVPREVRRSKWVEPKLVAEIAFSEFTSDGILRHPSFMGLREDKCRLPGAVLPGPFPIAGAQDLWSRVGRHDRLSARPRPR